MAFGNTIVSAVLGGPSAPVDSNATANSVAEGAAVNTPVGVTASSTSPAGSVTYSLATDSSGGGFKIDPVTGAVTVADPSKIDFETAPGHAYTITTQASDGISSSSQTFTIAVTDVAPSTPVDSNAATNTVLEGAANGTAVGVTASSTDVNGPAVTYSLTTDSSGGGFTINAATGVITVADGTKIDYESSPGHAYTVTAQASDGTLTSSQSFTINVGDVALTTPVDANATANSVAEGATNGTAVGITASAFDPNGPATTYSLSDSAGGRFAINSTTGVVTVANGSAIDFETSAGHAYGITVQATAGAQSTTQTFSIGVTDVGPSTPSDSNNAANSVFEGAANGTAVGITASSFDPGGGPAPTFSLTDNAGGRFAIDPNTGVVTVANGTAIDFETAPGPGHSYGITVQSTAGALSSTQNFSIGVGDVNEAPVGTDKTVTMLEGASYTFSVADFGFSDPSDSINPNSLLAVKMTTVPGAGAGTFTDNGVTVNAGNSVSATDIAGGHLVFTPAAHSNGAPEATFTFQVQDNGGTANGGIDLDQSPNTVTINVNAVNDAPINSVPGTQSVNEDATLTFSTGNGNAITISDVDVGSGNETVTLTVTSGTLALGSHAGLVSFSPDNAASITLTGTITNINAAMNGLTYHGNLNFNGADSLVVSTNDNGNTGAGGPKIDSDPITINVAAVNDAPVNSVPGAQTVNEDTNLVFSTGNGNAISVSDVDETVGNPETVTLLVQHGTLTLGSTAGLQSFTNNNSVIVLSGSVSSLNNALQGLTYKAAANYNGGDSLSVTIDDNGNTGSGGAKSDNDSVAISVIAVNDAPSFTVGGTQNALEDSGAHTVNGFITGISSGPADEAGQTVNFLTSNDNTALFSVGPAIDASGNLTYTLAANANGSATVTVQLHDNGGTANGGVDTSAAQTFVINAGPVNDAPSGTDNTLTTLEDTSHAFTAAEFGFSDPVDAANHSGANNFLDVVITTLPGAAGTLTDNGVTLVAGATVTKADIDAGLLVFNPAANANGNGEASFTFQVKDDGGTANSGVDTDQSPNTMTFNVTAVNDAPAGTDTTIASVGSHTFAASEFGFTDPVDAGSASGANAFQAVIITTIPGAGTGTLALNGVAVTAGQSIAASDIAGLVFTPVGNTTGTFTFQVQDNGGTANGGVDTDQSPNSFTISQNAAPVIDSDGGGATFAKSVAENQTAVTTVHATDPDNGPSPISYSIVGGDDHAKFAIDSSTGVLTFITAPDFENPTDTATDGSNTYIVAVQASDGASVDQQTITVTVTNVNEAPTAAPDAATAVEAGGIANATPGTNPAFNVLTGVGDTNINGADTDPDAGDTLTVQGVAAGTTGAALTTNVGSSVTGSHGSLKINTDGSTTYTMDNNDAAVQALRTSNQTLTDTFSYTAKDAGGLTSTTQVTVTIDGANDNPVANADAANVTEASGTANGTPGTNISSGFNVLTGAGSGSVADTDVDSVGNGETQTVSGVETGNHPADVVTTGAGAPLVGQYGTLTLNTDGSYSYSVDNSNATVDALNTGSHVDDVFTYTMHDQAGATSTTTLTVHVNGADDAPVATADSGYVAFEARAFTANAAAGVLANDTDVDTAHGSLTAVLNAGPSHAASFTLNSDGSFSYTGAAGYLGADSFTYHVNDGSLTSSVVTVSLDVQPLVWHIDNAHTGDPTQDGSAAHPFQSIAAFDTANAAAGAHPDIVYLHYGTGTYTEADGINLNNGQTLLGQGVDLTYQTSASSPGGVQTVTLLDTNNTLVPTIVATAGDGIDLAQNNTVEGLHVGNTSGTGIADNGGTVGTLDISSVDINTNHQAISFTHGGALNVTLSSTTSTGGADGIALGGPLTGSFDGGTGTLSGHSTSEFDVNGGTGTISYGGTIGDGTGLSASVANHTGGSVSFTGSITDGVDAGGGISLSGNTGATIGFSGGMTLNTGASNAFSATGGGTVNVTGTNHLTTTTGTALDISNTTIGSSNVTFQDINVNGATNGIILNNTGSGHLTVTGTGTTAGSGGTVQNTVQGALFTSTSNLSLSNMNFTNADSGNGTVNNVDDSTFNSAAQAAINLSSVSTATFTNLNVNGNGGSGGAQVGINGQNVSNLTIANSTVTGFGDDVGEGDVKLFNLSGTSAVTNSTFGFVPGDTTGGENLFEVRNNTGTLTLNVTGSTFHNTRDSANGSGGIALTSTGTATINANVSNSDFLNLKTSGFEGFAKQTSTMNVNITDGGTAGNGNIFDPTGTNQLSRAIGLNAQDTAHLNFNINRNEKIYGSGGPVINVYAQDDSNIQGRIDNNPDIENNNSAANSTGSPISINTTDNATGVVEVIGNTITDKGGDAGISAFATGGTSKFNAALDLTLQNNNISMSGSNTFGILIGSGASDSDTTKLYANVQNNAVTVDGSGNTAEGIENTGGGSAFVYLQGFTTDGVTTWNNQGNTPADSYAELININEPAAIPNSHNSGNALTPSNPTALFAAAGGVASASNSPGETDLSQAELNVAVAAAIAIWKTAGLSADQIAVLQHVTYDVANITPGWLGQSTPGHVTIDTSADGHGWFIDPTPSDNSEFAHAASPTDLLADPSSASAGHMDLITTVMHEMGEQLGLQDQLDSSDLGSLMYAYLGTGERVLPDGADVAAVNLAQSASGLGNALMAEAAVPVSAQASSSSPIVVGTAGNDTIDAGYGGKILFGGAGADTFVFGPNIQLGTPTAPAAQPLTHVADYSATQGDTFDFSALTSAFHNSSVSDALVVRAVEDASGTFATLQLNTSTPTGALGGSLLSAVLGPPQNAAAGWVSIAQLDGAHAGDAVNVLIDSHAAIHLAQIHVDLLA